MKVSILVGNLSSIGAGRWLGARVYLLAEALQIAGYDVEVLGFTFGGEVPDFRSLPFPVITEPGCTYPALFRSMGRLARKISGDVIYALRPKPTTFGIALLYRLIKHTPVVLDVDDWELSWLGGDSFRYRPTPKHFLRDLLKPNGKLRQSDFPGYLKWMETLTDRADAITIHTQFLRDRFGGDYIPNGKDTTFFDPSRYDPETSRQIYGLSEYRILMFPGAPRPYKGVEDVLEALELLGWDDLRLVIVGGSPYDDYDKTLQEKWGKWIIQLPLLPYAKMPEVVAAAHVVVVPQRDTPAALAQFPLKITDGMAMAKPIIGTTIGDIPQILGGCGVLVSPHAPDQIAEAIRLVFEDWDASLDRGRRARQRCIDLYSLTGMSKGLFSIFERVLVT